MWVPIIHFNGIASPSHHHHLARGTQFPMACVHWWKHNKGHQIKSSVPKNAVVITRIAYRRSETVREIPKKGKKQKCLYINIHRLKSSYEREERNFWLNKICERITTQLIEVQNLRWLKILEMAFLGNELDIHAHVDKERGQTNYGK